MEKNKGIFPFRKHPVGDFPDGKKGRKRKGGRLRRNMGFLMAAVLIFNTLPASGLAVSASEQEKGLCEHHPEHTAECGYAEAQSCTHEHGEECYKTVTECVHEHTDECYPETGKTEESTGEGDATTSDAGNREPSLCTHVCSEESGCITKVLDCHHEHDENCGYQEAQDCGYVCEICNGTEPEDTEDTGTDTAKCICETLCTEDSINGDCPVCGADDASFLDCKGKVPEENTENQEDTGICKHHQEHDADCGYIPKSEDGEGSPCTYECRICPIEDLIAALPNKVTEDNEEEVRAQLDEILALYRELTEDEQGQLDLSRIYALQGALDAANAPMTVAEEINISQTPKNILTAEDGGCQGHTFTGTAEGAIIYVESGTHDVTFSNLKITGTANVGVAPNATMNLAIDGTNTIHAGSNLAGIYVPVGATLVINGTGSLNVSGNGGGAGIGGAAYAPDEDESNGDPNCGTVEIKGGTVTATGGNLCTAGIGGGMDVSSNPGNGGTVTINGGTVTATGGSDGYYGGAGIGGGSGNNGLSSGSGGTLTINGGNVTLKAGQYDPKGSTAYDFGRGSGDVSGGTCELTLADASYLTADSLDPNGKYTINGDPTEDMIVVPELVYTGEVLDTSGIKIDDSKTGTGTYFGQTFTVNASAEGWVLQDLGEVKEAGEYTATFKKGDKEISKTFTVAQSGTDLTSEGKVLTYNGDTLTTTFTAGDTITVKATPTPTGDAPQKAAARLRADPTEGQMVVYVGTTQVSVPADKGEDGSYTMTVSAADVLLAAGGPDAEITLTAKFVENDNMADGAGTVKVNITAAAKAELDGKVIGYYGESNLDKAFANDGATVTLLDNITTSMHVGVDTGNLTLDLNGKTITKPASYGLYVSGSGHLTIRGNGKVICTGTSGSYPEAITSVGGTLTLEGGTFIGLMYGVRVDWETSVLSVTGESVSIQCEGRGLYISQAQSVELSAGTYSSVSVGSSNTLASLLAENCAYYSGSTPILLSELEGQKTLDGTVTVQECQHTGVEVKDLGSGKHGLDCPYCGYHSEHTTTLTATVSGNTVTFRGGCESCDYRAETLATAAFTIPKLTYGQTDQTVSCTWEHPDGYALMVQIDSGEELQLESSDTQVSLPLKQLFGSQEINAGNYQLHVYCRSYADVTSNVCSLPVTVDPAPLPEVTLSAESATYSGTEQKPALSVQQGETALTEGTDYEVSYTRDGVVTTDFTNAGTVNITVTGKGNYTGSVEKTYTIGKATPTIAWNPTDVETIYTGQPADVKPVVTLVNGETYSGEIHYSWYGVADSLVPPTDARTYGNIKASIPEQDNYNTAITQIGLNLHIDYADQAAPAAPAATEENIKDTSITLTIIANAEYKRGDGEWQESPTFTGLEPNQAYTFYARLKADDNHNASLSSTGTSITTKKTMLESGFVTALGMYTYTGAAIVPPASEVAVMLNGERIASDQYTISASNNINAGVGKATLTVTATETGNYSGSVSSTFTIAPATLYVAPNSQTIRYGEPIREGAGAISTKGLATGDHVVGVTLTPDTKDVPGGKIIASEVQIQNESGADVTGNYEITYVPGNLTINPAQGTLTVPAGPVTKTFGDGQFLLGCSTNGDGKISYASSDENVASVSADGNVLIKGAGEAVITVSLADGTNYTGAESQEVRITVAKAAAPAIPGETRNYTYLNGSHGAVTIDVAGKLPKDRGETTYTAAVTDGKGILSGVSIDQDGNLVYTVEANKAAGDTAVITVTAVMANYGDTAYAVTIGLVEKKTVEPQDGGSVSVKDGCILTYGQTLSDLTLETVIFVEQGTQKQVEGTLAWSNPSHVPEVADRTAQWVFTPKDNKEYEQFTGTAAITVVKATPETEAPEAAAVTYHPAGTLDSVGLNGGGAAWTVGGSAVTVEGTWGWKEPSAIPAVKNSGYTAVFTPKDTANYDTVERTVAVTVAKAEPYIATPPTAAQITYGDALDASALTGGTVQYSSSDGTAVTGSFAWKDGSIKPDSGSAAYTVVFTPADSTDYSSVETQVTLVTGKAENAPDMPPSAMNVARRFEKVGDVGLPEGWQWQDTDRDTALEIGVPVTATAVYTGADRDNYRNVTVSVTITRADCDHEHTETRNAVTATCQRKGYTGDTWCLDCGELLAKGTETDLADHSGGTATCIRGKVCQVCGTEYTGKDSANHMHTEIRGAIKAGCTSDGYTGDTYCTDCGAKTGSGRAVPAAGHDWHVTREEAATTTSEGRRIYTCSKCGQTREESIPKLPQPSHTHSYSPRETKAATCTENGVITYSCSCGDSYTQNTAALGHSYRSGVTKQPTVSAEGVMTYTCGRCGHSYTRPIAKLPDIGTQQPGTQQPGDTEPGSGSTEETRPDTGIPFIKGEDGKTGWDVIRAEEEKAQEGSTINVDMNGTTVVPGDIFDSIRGRDITVTFDMGGGILWSVNGKEVITDKAGDIDFSVKTETNAIPVDIVNNVTGERYSIQISLAHEGEFGFTAVLSIGLGRENAGYTASLYYYNENTGELEFICSDEVAEDGTVSLAFTHASDYVIAIDGDGEESGNAAEPAQSDTSDKDSTGEAESPKTGQAWRPWWFIVVGALVIVMGIGVFLAVRKKQETENS